MPLIVIDRLASNWFLPNLFCRNTRTANVRAFLDLICPTLQHDTPPLQDVYGPTATDPDVQAVLVSEETRGGAASSTSIHSDYGNVSTAIAAETLSPLDICSRPKAQGGWSMFPRALRHQGDQP
jgi:phosphopantetheine adenylyltransferase